MEKVPYVYIFKPGASTARAAFRGIKNTLGFGNLHYWEIESYAGTLPNGITGITLKQKSGGDQRLVLREGLNEISGQTILCSLHPIPGETPPSESDRTSPLGSPEIFMTGNYPGYHLSNATYFPSPEWATIVEYPDAITIALHVQTDVNLWGFMVHAGLVLTPENRSDPYYGIEGFGIFGGLTFIQRHTPADNQGGRGAFTIGGQTGVYRYIRQAACINEIDNQPVASRILSSSGTWVMPRTFNRYEPLSVGLRNVGNNSEQDRLVPYRIYGTTGAVLGSTRYIRQKYYGIGTTTPVFIDERSVAESEDSDIAWAHRIASLIRHDPVTDPKNHRFQSNTVFAYNKNIIDLTGNTDI